MTPKRVCGGINSALRGCSLSWWLGGKADKADSHFLPP